MTRDWIPFLNDSACLAVESTLVPMLSYLMRQTLLDALATGPPHKVFAKHIHNTISQIELLKELERRGLITSGPIPVLTIAGIAEAKWFTSPAKQKTIDPMNDGSSRKGLSD